MLIDQHCGKEVEEEKEEPVREELSHWFTGRFPSNVRKCAETGTFLREALQLYMFRRWKQACWVF